MIELYYFSLIVLIGTLIYASIVDIKYRKIPFETWYPLIFIGTLSTMIYLFLYFKYIVLLTCIILITTVIIFWLCGHFKLLGGADSWALIFITIFTITIPFHSLLNNSTEGIAVSTYINALILFWISYPVYIKIKEYKPPFIPYICIGFIISILFGDIFNYIAGVLV
jgi:archaeal preflagellin peptidase FlaK